MRPWQRTCAVSRRALLFFLLVTATAGAIACTTAANVGDLSRGSAESGAPGLDGEAPDASSSDAPPGDPDGAPPPSDAGCGVTFAQEATFIDVQVQNGVPPDHSGGTVVPGTYVLTAMSVYFAGTTGTVRMRETMEVHGGSPSGTLYRLIEAQNASGSFANIALHGERSLYESTNNPAFFVTAECPAKGFQRTGEFTAQGTTLVVYDAAKGIERTYRRLR